LIDAAVSAALSASGAVLIEGPKWCGKTWTGMTHAQSAIWVSDPTGGYLTRRLAASDPLSLLDGPPPVLIDEWQDAPGLWDAVRMAVDRRPGPGQYLLTGSATPRDGVVSHSGTGRVARVSMWPMTASEAGLAGGGVSLAGLLRGDTPMALPGAWTPKDVTQMIVRGGWPATIDLPLTDAARVAADYVRSIAFTDVTVIDAVRRDPVRVTALLAALARSTATVVANTTLTRDMAASDGGMASTRTVADYVDVLRRLHVLKEIPAWSPALRSPVRLRQRPKRILCDPSLAAAAIGASVDGLLADLKTTGLLFENLCLRDLSVYAAVSGADVFHYHDESELEADAIIQTPDRRWMAIEIKFGAAQEDVAARSLLALSAKMQAAGEQAPAALVVLTGTGSFAHRRDDGVVVVPFDKLEA